MSIRIGKRFKTSGGSLVVTLVICSVLSFSVLGYLSVIEQQGTLGRRSQSWNVAMAVAEAGIEEGMQHLNANWNNLTRDGWTVSGTLYVKSNSLPDGNSYSMAIAYGSQPIVVSKSYVNGIAVLARAGQMPMFATISPGNDLPVEDNISRGVRVRAYRGGYATKALAAKNQIDLNGNNILTDSFDSEDLTKSNNGLYDPSRAGDNGDVVSNSSITNSIDVGNANIYGHVATGPGGSVSVGDRGGVGSHDYQAVTEGTAQDGWVTHDSNFTFPDTTIPYTSGLTPESGDIVETVIQVVTNATTSSTHPGTGGVQTNIVTTTTSSTYPNPPPYGLTTNVLTVTSSTYPSSPVGTVRTNYIGTVTSTTYPSPPPPDGVTTNVNWQTSGSFPSGNYVTVKTNVTWRKEVKTAPQPGTYVGEVEINGSTYSYWEITGYTWSYYTYTYKKYTYTYTTYTYTYPIEYSYTYNLYSTNILYQTNYYDNILYSGQYYLETLSGKTIVLGQAELVVGNGVHMSGSDVLKIKPGGSLTNWIDGTTVAIGGNGIMNETGLAKNYIAFCSTNVVNVAIGGNGEFTGVFIAPNGNMQMNGGGRETFDFIGSVMVNTVTLHGNFQFHYDEALGRLPSAGRFLIGSWDEIPIRLLDDPSTTAL